MLVLITEAIKSMWSVQLSFREKCYWRRDHM